MNRTTDRRTHFDLLDQVADSTAEAREVRRILGGLTERELDSAIAYKQARSCSVCANGAPCSTPEACRINTAERGGMKRDAAVYWLIVCALLIVAVVALGFVAP